MKLMKTVTNDFNIDQRTHTN